MQPVAISGDALLGAGSLLGCKSECLRRSSRLQICLVTERMSEKVMSRLNGLDHICRTGCSLAAVGETAV
jgi:hypothetical protein